jgi:thiol-disulfide isomerase/thioredoxin
MPDTQAEPGVFTPTGTVLAGTAAPLIEFNRTDYDAALADGKVILLYFYASWCPICRVEFQDTESAFRELADASVVGFRVSYNDDETDDDEESLARQFGIAYQHTKVILVDGTPALKDGSTWDRDRYIQELTAAVIR